MKSRNRLFFWILYTFLLLSLATNVGQFLNTRKLKQKLPSLLIGDEVDYFNLIALPNEKSYTQNADLKKVRSNQLAIVFIFERPCAPCNHNLKYWMKIQQILKEKVNFYGIVIDSLTIAHQLATALPLSFPIYIPEKAAQFIDSFHARSNKAQTLILKHGRVLRVFVDRLSDDDFLEIVQFCKSKFRQEN